VVAVKKLESFNQREKEFQKEVRTIGTIEHPIQRVSVLSSTLEKVNRNDQFGYFLKNTRIKLIF